MVGLAAFGAAGVVVLSSMVRKAGRQGSSAAKSLGALWVGGVETMVDVPGAGTLSLAPAESAEASKASFERGVPSALRDGCFALTAFDPPGVSRTRDENAKANGELWQVLLGLGADAGWRGYGVDLDEGWREDGFILRFADADVGRPKVTEAARAFHQGAIYEYYARDGALYRRTLGVAMEMDETTPMRLIDHAALAARSEMVRWPWAGPADGGVIEANARAP